MRQWRLSGDRSHASGGRSTPDRPRVRGHGGPRFVNRYQPLLRNAGFRAVWLAAVVSGLGDRIAAIALYLLIYRLSGDPMDLGILAATQIVPAILLGPVAGLVCDRRSRRGVMISSDLLSALVVAAVPLAQSPGQVYALAVLLGCGRQFTGPARMALLPDLVGRDLVGGANSLLMLTRNLVLLVGPAIGGALVAWQGTDPAFWLDAMTFVASAAVLTFGLREVRPGAVRAMAAAAGAAEVAGEATIDEPPRPERTLKERVGELWRDAVAGLSGVWDHRGLRVAFGFFAILTFVTAMQQPLVVVFVKDVLGGSDRQLGFIIAAAGLGGILGALAGATVAGRRRPLGVIALLTALDGALLLIFAANRDVMLALVIFAGFGAVATLAQIALATFLQQMAPDDRRGRTFGWLGTVVGPLSLAAVFLGPWLASVLGVVAVLAMCGAAELLVAVAGFRARDVAGTDPSTAQNARPDDSVPDSNPR
ncbi:MFS transporter [bacterium]|nr:MFS transporter [bacterium]